MFQNHQDEFFNREQRFQNGNKENNGLDSNDEESVVSEAIAEEPLSMEKLADISAGVGEIKHSSFEGENSLLEPGPTFPVPPYSEKSP